VLDQAPPSSELDKLKSIAPVFTSLQSALSYSGRPLQYPSGLTGMAFWDQHNRLIVTASNPGTSAVKGAVTLKTLPSGTYSALDLFTGAKSNFTISNGVGWFMTDVDRWDTRAYAITRI
jgi:hypothetical protein